MHFMRVLNKLEILNNFETQALDVIGRFRIN